MDPLNEFRGDPEMQQAFRDLQQRHLDFLGEARGRVPVLLQGIRSGDADGSAKEELHALAHRIHGSSATFGFKELSASAAELEAALLELRERRGPIGRPEQMGELEKLVQGFLETFPRREG